MKLTNSLITTLIQTGEIIKWSVFLGLFVIFMVYWIVGSAHAKRRIRRGQMPLSYHRVRSVCYCRIIIMKMVNHFGSRELAANLPHF